MTDPGGTTSRLVCVMFTDIAQSTETMTTHGPAVAAELRRAHDEIVTATIEQHDGTVVDTNGDGVMALLPTATLGVSAAVGLLAALHEHGQRADTAAPIRLRIGLAAGEVTSSGRRHVGNAVVEAARLEAEATPGTILATQLVETLATDVSDAVFEDHGERELRGFPEPVRVCAVRPVDLGRGPLDLPKELLDTTSTTMVGREAPWSILERQWSRAVDGRLVIGALTGDAGSGKSRLLAEFAHRCQADGAVVLHGSSDPELDVPYQSIADALRRAAPLDTELAAGLGGSGSLAPLFSEIADGDQPATERRELFAAGAMAFRRLATLRPVLLILDDLHWVKASTVQFLRSLVSELSDSRVLVLVGYRPGEVGPGHVTASLVAEPGVQASLETIALEPLGANDVVRLAVDHAGRELTSAESELARRIHADCGGSPFFVGEVLRHLLATSGVFGPAAPDDDATRDVPVPPTVTDLVVRRAEGTGADALRLLSVAAVAGPSFDVDIVAEAAGMNAEDALDLLEVAVEISLCRESSGGRFSFAHDIARSALAGRLSGARTLRTHVRLAEALEATRNPPLDELVRHWTAAATDNDHERAVHYLRLAGERDERALAWETAAGRYEQILELVGSDGEREPQSTALTWLALGRARREAGDVSYRDAMAEAGRLGRRIADGEIVGRAAVGFLRSGGWFVDATYTDERMIGLSEQALELLAADDPLRVSVLAALATVSPFAHTLERREELAEEALTLARRLGDGSLLVSALTAIHLTHWTPHHLKRRRAVAEELRSLADRLDDPRARWLGAMFGALVDLEERGDCSPASLAELHRLAEATGSFWFEFLVERLRIATVTLSGVDDARPAIDELFVRANGTLADATGTWAAQHAEVARHADDFGSVVGALTGAADRAGPQGIWGYALVIALADAGDLDEARSRVCDVAVEPNRDYLWLVSMQMFAEAAFRTERADLCARIHDELAPFEGCVGMIASGTVIWGPVALSLAFAARGAGREELVAGHLEVARAVAQRVPMPFALRQIESLASM